jgi:phosphatidylinositol-3-phosphatase
MVATVVRHVRAFLAGHPRFGQAVLGALVMAAFSLIGGVWASNPSAGAPSTPLADRRTGTRSGGATAASLPAAPHTATVPAPGTGPGTSPPVATPADRPAHVVIVLLEGDPHGDAAPWLSALARHGAVFPAATAVPGSGYLAVFRGSGAGSPGCAGTLTGATLATRLAGTGKTFTGYAQSMPSDGYRGCDSGAFTRDHTPWIGFRSTPASESLRFSRFPTRDFGALPTVSLVVPNRCDDGGTCPAGTADAWLKDHLGGYASWARTHDSLLIVTSGGSTAPDRRMPLVLYGERVRSGVYQRHADQYSVLRTVEDFYHLPCLANSCDARGLETALR